jgi:RNA polymerase sigma factor (sigma-70 family)
MAPDDAASHSSDFDEFLKAMGPRIKRLLAAHRIPAEDAEDVLQQALLALVPQWTSIREPEAWLTVTLQRNCLMYWRKTRRRLYSAVDAALLEFLSQPVAPQQERDGLMLDLQGVLQRLPVRCRRLLDLRYARGYDPPEVARQLGYRESSIGKVTARCLAALTRELLLAQPRRAARNAPADGGAARRRPATPRHLREPFIP